MRITDLPKTKDILMNNLFITDGDGGTRAIFADDLARALYNFLDDEDKVGTVNFDKILATSTVADKDKILLNTDEGNRAISIKDLQYAFMDAVANTPQRRNTFRGKNLGSSVTQSQLEEIGNGTFRDLFIGDYWEINNNKWRIADMDYWLSDQDGGTAKHNLTIVPDTRLAYARYNATATTSGGYLGSELFTNMKNETNNSSVTQIKNAFGNNVYWHTSWFSNAVTNGRPTGAYIGTTFWQLMFSTQAIGEHQGELNAEPGTRIVPMGPPNQFALFRLAPWYIWVSGIDGLWLSDITSATTFGCIYISSNALGAHSDRCNANNALAVRPQFTIANNNSTKRIQLTT